VLIPVPAAEAVAGPFRREHDPVAIAGVPAHVTLIVPWLPPDEITPADLAELDETLADAEAFDFSLTRVEWFGRRVMWLAPEPAKPFLVLTARLADRFGTPPWDDEFDEVVPHLTIGHASDGAELASEASRLAAHLPIRCRADEVWVMVGDGTRWSLRHRVPLS
jgi:2'-5' RNA ligase